MELRDLQQEFINKLVTDGKSPNTIKNYRADLETFQKFLNPVGTTATPKVKIKDLSEGLILSYGEHLYAHYQSNNSRRRRIQTLRNFFDFLIIRQLVDSNPVKGIPSAPKFVDIPRPTPYGNIVRLWQSLCLDRQKKEVLPSLQGHRNLLVMMLVYGCGLQAAQLSELRRSQLLLTGPNPRVMIYLRKRDPYSIPLPISFPTLFKEYERKKAKHYPLIASSSGVDPVSAKIFFNANHHTIISDGISVRGLEIMMKDVCAPLNIQITLKNLRQACIYKWIHQNQPDETIKEWLGVAPEYSLSAYYETKNDFIYQDHFFVAGLGSTESLSLQ